MKTFEDLSGEVFGNKFLATTIAYVAPKDLDEPFKATTLAEEMGLAKPNLLYSSLGRLLRLELIGPRVRDKDFDTDLFRLESGLWLPISELANFVVTTEVERPGLPSS